MTTKKEFEDIEKMFDGVDSINRLRECREKKGLSQRQVAEFVKTSQQNIALYENGERTPKVDIIVKLADLYNVSIYYLLGLSSIKSYDMKLQGVCEYTGLSEKAINNIEFSKYMCDEFGRSYNNKALDHFLRSGSFRAFSMYLHTLDRIYRESKSDKENCICAESVIDNSNNEDFKKSQRILSEYGYKVIDKAEAFFVYLQRAVDELKYAFSDWADELDGLYRQVTFDIELEDTTNGKHNPSQK